MKSLYEVLVDYHLTELQALAHKRGLEPPQNRSSETLRAFAEALLSPVSVAIALDDLSGEERAALDHLLTAGSRLEAPKFARRFGTIRSMGPNKLLREQPWQSPQSPAEGLWYRGLIVKGFHHTSNGPEEIIFIPDDLQPILPLQPAPKPTFEIGLAPIPTLILASTQTAKEDLFRLLVYLQTDFVRLEADSQLPARHRQALLADFCQPGLDDTAAADHWLQFLLHLANRLDLLQRQGARLRLNAETARVWLQLPPDIQIQQLQTTWRSDPTWNDLWHVPALQPKPTGWENSPLRGRAKILNYIAQAPANEWISFNEFSRAIKRTEPDFQRPSGDYQSWYIYDHAGKALMGFEHWDEVEGHLIRYLIGTLLFALGVVDLGAPGEGLPPVSFRVTARGRQFLDPDAPAPEPKPARTPSLRVNADHFTIRIPHDASLYDRFQLARFAELVRREEKRAIYRVTRESYRRALEQSIALEQILSFLSRASGASVPLALVEAMRAWDRRSGSVRLERLTVLRVNQPDMAAELINHRDIGPLLGGVLGPEAILVPEKNLAAVRKLLLELGYLEDDKG